MLSVTVPIDHGGNYLDHCRLPLLMRPRNRVGRAADISESHEQFPALLS